MKIFQLKKDFQYTIGSGRGIGFLMHYKKGDIFFKPRDDSDYTTIGPNYYPANGSYAVSETEDFKFVDEYLEFVEETDKPLDYFTGRKYSTEDMRNCFQAGGSKGTTGIMRPQRNISDTWSFRTFEDYIQSLNKTP